MHAIGVDIGGTKIAAGVVDQDGVLIAKLRRDTDADDSAAVDATIVEVCRELMAEHEVGAIGLAAPGFISSDQATVLFTPNLPWREHPLRDVVRKALGTEVPIVVENDANAAGWAEFRYGPGAGHTDMLMLTIGTGLGAAVIVGGQLVRGAWGVAAEAGHMRVVPQGQLCGCGHHGCWEQYASGSALVRDTRAAIVTRPDAGKHLLAVAGGDPDALTGPQITQAAQDGDQLAVDQLAELGRWIGEGSATYSALLDPSVIVIGGGVGAAGDLLLAPARAAFEKQLSAVGYRPVAEIVLASMGNDAGIVGAADLARRAQA